MGADTTLLRYTESCTSAATGYIERATRYNVKDVRVLEARPTVYQFLVTIRHALEVVSNTEDRHGVHQPGAGDFGSADWTWYQSEKAQQAESELRRPQTMDDLVTTVTGQAYATIAARTLVRTHPRRLFHTYTCSGCSGAGKVTCSTCSGSGEVSCTWCGGSGRTSCSACGGSGNVSEHRQVTDYNGYSRSETQHRSCYSCSGGRVHCSSCGGSGCKQCGTCGGCGQVTCSGCSGHGYLTKITSTHTYTNPHFSGRYREGTPDYVHDALCKVGFATLAQHGHITFRDVQVQRDTASVEFVYQCEMHFCELSLEVMGLQSNWAMFGDDPQIFDAGGVLEALLKSDVERLRTVADSSARWRPWFHRAAGKAVAPFMESEVNQELIDASRLGLAPAAIVERLNRSVSDAYVQASPRDLTLTVKAAAYWSRAKWLAAFALLSIAYALGVTAYQDRNEKFASSAPNDPLYLHVNPLADFNWEMGWRTLPITVMGWFVARWISRRWLAKSGGTRLLEWATGRGLLLGKWTGLTIVAVGMAAAGMFYQRMPLWIDAGGKAYGMLPLFPKVELIALDAPKPVIVEKKPRKKKPKRAEAATGSAQTSADQQPKVAAPDKDAAAPVDPGPKQTLF